MKCLSIIVPCFNEEQNISEFYEKTSGVMDKLSEKYEAEYIFVDDGSTDNTAMQLKQMAKLNSNVKYISFTRNFGKEAAMYAGMQAAQGDLTVIMDCDLQDPPSMLPKMLELIESGYDTVATRRVNRKGEPPVRSFFARMFYRIINKMSDVEIPGGARDFRMMNRSMVNAVIKVSEVNRFSKGIFAWVGFKCAWLEYENENRKNGTSKWSFWKLFNYAIEGIVSFTTVPLRFASLSGIIVSAFAICYMLFIVIRTIIYGIDVPGYASFMSVILLLGGMMLFSMGILGEYLARTYMEGKNRPMYLVRESTSEGDAQDANEK